MTATADEAALKFLREMPRAGAGPEAWAEWRAQRPTARLVAELNAAEDRGEVSP